MTSVSRCRRNQYCVYSQEETTCFTSASVTNHLPSTGFSRDKKKDGNIGTVETVVHDLPALASKLVSNPIGTIRLSVTVQNDATAQQPTPWDKLPQPLTYLHNAHPSSVILVNESDKKHGLMVRKGSWRDFPFWRRCVTFLRSGLRRHNAFRVSDVKWLTRVSFPVINHSETYLLGRCNKQMHGKRFPDNKFVAICEIWHPGCPHTLCYNALGRGQCCAYYQKKFLALEAVSSQCGGPLT